MTSRGRQGRQVAFGAAIIAALSLVALLIFFLSNILRYTRDTYQLVAVFDQAPRLRVGSQVWISGYPVGHVDRIEFLHPGVAGTRRLALILEIPTRFQSFIRRDSYVRISGYRLLGDPAVDVIPGSPGQPQLQPGDTLRALPHITLGQLLAKGTAARAALDSLHASVVALDSLVRARQPSFQRAGAALDAARAEYGRLAAQLDDGALGRFLQDSAWQASLARLEASSRQILDAFRHAHRPTPAADTEAALQRLVQRAEQLSQQLDHLKTLLSQPNGSLGRLAQDSALAAALRRARAQLDSLAAEAREDPLRFIF